MPTEKRLHLFDACGIELEYMVVDRETLDVRPISHHLLLDPAGKPTSEVAHGNMAWSNELTQHVLELKTNGPRTSLAGLAADFQQQVQTVNQQLAIDHAQLLPTAMHPWMNPDQEMQLWPFDYSPVYKAFHQVFDCRGHGWANLQSMHINLPFAGDAEFGRLHAAIRLVLPVLPGLAASSPWMELRHTGCLDQRLHVYANNARKIPGISGRIIPEPFYTQADYEARILQPMYAQIAPFDPAGVLQDEFLNARGAIARFDRGAIEIRVIDVQECPLMDMAIAVLTIAVIKKLVSEAWTPLREQQLVDVEQLRDIFDGTVRDAELSNLQDVQFLRHFGIQTGSLTVREFWCEMFAQVCDNIQMEVPEVIPAIEMILDKGCLARRLLSVHGTSPTKTELMQLYQRLTVCLDRGEMFFE